MRTHRLFHSLRLVAGKSQSASPVTGAERVPWCCLVPGAGHTGSIPHLHSLPKWQENTEQPGPTAETASFGEYNQRGGRIYRDINSS